MNGNVEIPETRSLVILKESPSNFDEIQFIYLFHLLPGLLESYVRIHC